MTEASRFWTTGSYGDGATPYTMAQIAEVFRTMFTADNYASQGVVKGYLNELAVSGTATPLTVATGAAMVYGSFYTNDASRSVTITTPSTGTTGHRLVLRASWSTTQTVRITDIASADGTADIPAATQTAGTTYDITLATFTVTTGGVIAVTDARNYCAFATYLTTADLPVDSVDDTVVGNRVPALTRRQGGSATNWATAGSSNYTPTTVRMQCGSVSASVSAASGNIDITFPVAFSQNPIMLCSYIGTDIASISLAYGSKAIDSSSAKIYWVASGSITQTLTFSWLAIGPE